MLSELSGGMPCEGLPVPEPRLAGEIADTEAADWSHPNDYWLT